MILELGQTINNFRLMKPIGSGEMGDVYWIVKVRKLIIIATIILLHNILIPTFEARELQANSILLSSFAGEDEVITGNPQRMASPDPEELLAGNKQTIAFPEDFFGVWIAKNSDYVEPNGWEDWYREIYIYINDVGYICIQYGSLVFSVVRTVELEDDSFKIGVCTEFDENTYYYLIFENEELFVKAPRILVNEPDTYKEYYRIRKTNSMDY